MSVRIAIDANPLFYPGTGVWRVTRALLDELLKIQTAYEFTLFSRQMRNGTDAVQEFNGHPIRRLRITRGMAELARPVGLNEFLVRADLYHATDHYLPLKRPERAVVTIHDLLFLIAPEMDLAIAQRFFARKVPAFARKCARVIAISESTKRDILERLEIPPERIDVVPWAVDRRVFHPSTDDDALRARLKQAHDISYPFFLAVSCSEERKNTPRLLEAYARFAERDPRLHLVVRWNCPAALKEKYQRGKLAQLIHFCGHVDDDGLADLYRGATAMLFPSFYEGFGLPVLEAMSCGTPAVTSSLSSLPEVGGDAARYIDPNETDSIVQALRDFEEDAPCIRGLREKGLAQADKFSWERTARMTLDVYAKALGGR